MLNLLQVLGKLSLITFLVSSMVTAGLGLTPKGLMAPLRDRRLLWLYFPAGGPKAKAASQSGRNVTLPVATS